MTKKNQTKRALISSVIALMLCFSMLVGTTFAWFTDSVSSAKNTIVAGNLDVELEYATAFENGAVKTWTSVDNKEDLFDPNALWEPGHAEVVYLKVSNLGSLSLKYQLRVNVFSETPGVNAEGNAIYLSKYLVFDVVEMDTDLTVFENREAAIEATEDKPAGLGNYNGDVKALDASGKGNDVDYVALIVYMPETVGNEANYVGDKVPTIELGVDLFATQEAADFEKDSFGNDYDAGAFLPVVNNAAELSSALAQGQSTKLGGDIDLNGESIDIPTNASSTLDLAGNQITGGSINNAGTLTIKDSAAPAPTLSTTDTSAVAVPGSIGAKINNSGKLIVLGGVFNAQIVNDGEATITGATVNADWSRSEGHVIHNNGTMEIAKSTISSNGANGGSTVFNSGKLTVTDTALNGAPFGASGNPSYAVNNTGTATLTNVTINAQHGCIASYDKGTVTLNNVNATMGLNGKTHAVVYTYNEGSVIINGGVYTNQATDQNATGASAINGNVIVNSGVINGRIENYYGTPVIKGGTFSVQPNAKFMANGYTTVKHADGVYYVTTNGNADLYITNVEELKAFAASVNGGNSYDKKTVVLLADIDLNGETWTPIGISSDKGFSGTFDGQAHTVSNFALKTSEGGYGAGFFGNLLNGATIKNVNFDSVSYTTRANVVGVVAGYLYGSGTFENINVINANVQSFGKVGGILGMAADPGAHTITMTNCSVEGVISGGYNVGGLIGLVLQGQTVNITDCDTDVVFYINDGGYNYSYVKTEAGWMWNYNNQPNYAGVAEQYCYYDAQENEFCMGEPVEMYFAVETAAQFEAVAQNGGTVLFLNDITGNVTLNQNVNVDLVIDGNGKKFDGNINIKAQSNTTASGSITIKNINFKTNTAKLTFISSSETNHYPLNVTVSNCTFEGTGADSSVVGISIKSAKNFVIENCTATKVHSLLQNTSGWDLTVRNVTVTESGRGMALGTVQGVTVEKATVECAKYGIRLDTGYNNNAVITDCDITAFIPVVVRKATVNSSVTFNGTNTMTETNTDGIWCAIGTSEYEANGSLPTDATATITVVLNDTGLAAEGVYGAAN